MNCRFCGNSLSYEFLDLGSAPLSNAFMKDTQLDEPETYFPLRVLVCEKCFLVQVDQHKIASEIFSDEYVYLSSTSRTWLEHSRKYVEAIIPRLALHPGSRVVEIASNDGYLLQYFMERNIPCLGIEPTASTAEKSKKKGIRVVQDFFGTKLALSLARAGECADLVLGNNVLAHVPDINDFVAGLAVLLREDGTLTMEFPHLMHLVERCLFDTIYHEHFSYLSFKTTRQIFLAHGLELFDVDELSTHGGSIRIYGRHLGKHSSPVSKRVEALLEKERLSGMGTLDYYLGMKTRVEKIKLDFLSFLVRARQDGKRVAAYGAAAKGNTLFNYCGIKSDLIEFVVDAAPSKEGKFLPGSRIPVVNERFLREQKPDYVVVVPWNIQEEIIGQLAYIREWAGKFVLAMPVTKVV